MIAKQGWFVRRKYSGWGFTPKTWQGWLYTFILILPFILMSLLGASAETQALFSFGWIVVIIIALVDIAKSIKKDERDVLHEAIAERNALWVIILILVLGIAYQVAGSVASGVTNVDPIILVALIGGVITKAITNLYFDKRD